MKRILKRLREKEIEFNDPQKLDPDSYDAYYDKDTSGPEENDVIVGNFIWNREKSNQNIVDVGENKGGFSFYYARHAYDDDNLYPIPKEKNKKRIVPGRYYVVGQMPDENRLLVIDIKETLTDGEEYIRILSARLANDEEERLYEHSKWLKNKAKERRREETDDWRIRFKEAVEKRAKKCASRE
jgi:uncharacterized DUF497 family protein